MDASSAPAPFKRLDQFSLMDLESLWLILNGQSVVDWHRVNLPSAEDAQTYLRRFELDPDRPSDAERIAQIQATAVAYLRGQFDFPIPKPLVQAPVDQLLRVASGKGHRQLCACTILKAMHIIHHVEARELRFSLPMSDQDVFRLVEERVYRLVGRMLAEGLPVIEFVGGQKRRTSVYTKLLSKPGAHASAVYDKLRFRIVTRTRADLLPVLLYLSDNLFAFNYVVPGESINTILRFRQYCRDEPHLRGLLSKMQLGALDDFNTTHNQFSADSYRIIHFVVDLPVRVPEAVLAAAPEPVRALGPVIFGLCEFQLADRESDDANEAGDASHTSYKTRQLAVVRRRLKVGQRDGPRAPSSSPPTKRKGR
ncbi:MAG: TIGR04552 family protein [Deltaproteobacteria bacterium]|jgi:uncharacterized protein (TIGR04552 family)|nr:TIGR04552 family protein [Deltaproteobacteria bacterium]MBW2531537.1 TIGR04552 family protein [Deltaproteobacteria bacterium]